MIEHRWHQDHGILEVEPHGPLQASDFSLLAEQVDPVLRERELLSGLLINGSDFSGWEDFSALLSHFRFVREHHRHIHKVAVLSDHSLLRLMPALVSHFVSAEARPFSLRERREALEWLAAPG
nr:STAS/SEC14 domain-containing protein [Microbulbifer guangxiensis]